MWLEKTVQRDIVLYETCMFEWICQCILECCNYVCRAAVPISCNAAHRAVKETVFAVRRQSLGTKQHMFRTMAPSRNVLEHQGCSAGLRERACGAKGGGRTRSVFVSRKNQTFHCLQCFLRFCGYFDSHLSVGLLI